MPKVPRTAEDQTAGRCQRIVEAAFVLVQEMGLDGFTIRSILEQSGLSRRAFYECFSGKDDLVLALFEYSIRLAVARWSEQMHELANPLERLRLIITSIAMGKNVVARTEPIDDRRGIAMSREHLRLAESRPQDLQKALQPLLSLLAQQIADGITAGVVRNSDPQIQAMLVYNLVSTTVHTELLAFAKEKGGKRSREQVAEALWEFCYRALQADS